MKNFSRRMPQDLELTTMEKKTTGTRGLTISCLQTFDVLEKENQQIIEDLQFFIIVFVS